jgi:ParB family chromosome partitioning protein
MSATKVIAKSTPAKDAPTTRIEWLSVRALEPNPFQPRIHFDEAALQELADDIAEQGILQPILVRPCPGKKNFWQIAAGERRWRAAQLAKQKVVPCIVRNWDDVQMQEIALKENIQRESLTDYEEAQGILNLWKAYEQSGKKVSIRFLHSRLSKSQSFIRDRVNLFKLHPEVVEMTKRHRGVMTAAEMINKVSDKGRRLEYIRRVDEENLSVAGLEHAINEDDAREQWRRESQTPDRETKGALNKLTLREREAQKEIDRLAVEIGGKIMALKSYAPHVKEEYFAEQLLPRLEQWRTQLKSIEKR